MLRLTWFLASSPRGARGCHKNGTRGITGKASAPESTRAWFRSRHLLSSTYLATCYLRHMRRHE